MIQLPITFRVSLDADQLQLPESKTITIQLLGKDDINFDDSEVLTERWQTYIDSFVQARCHCTKLLCFQYH
jgi:hypothetical protein